MALSTASTAPRCTSSTARHEPTNRLGGSPLRHDNDTITTVASNALTAFTPSSSNVIRVPTACWSASTAACAAHRSSAACVPSPSAVPVNWSPGCHSSDTFDRHRPLGRRSNEKFSSLRRSRCVPFIPSPSQHHPSSKGTSICPCDSSSSGRSRSTSRRGFPPSSIMLVTNRMCPSVSATRSVRQSDRISTA